MKNRLKTIDTSVQLQNDPDDVGRKHNEYLEVLLGSASQDTDREDMVELLVNHAKNAGDLNDEVNVQVMEAYLMMRVSRPMHGFEKIGDHGLGANAIRTLNRYWTSVGFDSSKSALEKARSQLDEDARRLDEAEAAIITLAGGMFTASIDFWKYGVGSEALQRSTHVYTDWGAVAASDVSAVIAEAATWGAAAAFFGVTPPTAATAGAILAISGAIASFLFFLSGAATREVEREPITPAPGEGDDRGPGEGPSV